MFGHSQHIRDVRNGLPRKLYGNGYGVTLPQITRERDVLIGAFKYGAEEDYGHTTGSSSGTPEGVAMFYWFDKTIPAARRKDMAARLLYWCEKADVDLGCPIFYNVDFATGVLTPGINSQHALWGAKMLFDHWERFSDTACLTRAKQIVDWVIANMFVGETPNRRLLRFTTDAQAISIKPISSADVILRVGEHCGDSSYKEIYDEYLAWVQANMTIESTLTRFYTQVDSDNPSNVTEGWYSHTTLETVDGLLDAYDAVGDTTYYDLALKLFEDAILDTAYDWWTPATTGHQSGGMADFQVAYISKRLGKQAISERLAQKRLEYRKADGTFAPFGTPTDDGSIFAHTYLMAWLHTDAPFSGQKPKTPTPILSVDYRDGAFASSGSALTMQGADGVDYSYGYRGLSISTNSGSADIALSNLNPDDFALLLDWTNDAVLGELRGIWRIHDTVTTNNDIYLRLRIDARSDTEVLVAFRKTGSSFANVLTTLAELPAGARCRMAVWCQDYVAQFLLLVGDTPYQKVLIRTALMEAVNDMNVKIGGVGLGSFGASLGTFRRVQAFSPAPPIEQMRELLATL